MARSVRVEYRAVARDRDASPEHGVWRACIDAARGEAMAWIANADPPFDEIWLERRVLMPPQRMASSELHAASRPASNGEEAGHA